MSSTVAIVGGGIAGDPAALQGFSGRIEAGLNVTVYEQAAELKEVGAGVVVSPNAMRLLRRLGGLDQFLGAAVPIETDREFRRWQDGA